MEIQTIASRALDRCAAAATTWTRHTAGAGKTTKHSATRIATHYRELETSGRKDEPGLGKAPGQKTWGCGARGGS